MRRIAKNFVARNFVALSIGAVLFALAPAADAAEQGARSSDLSAQQRRPYARRAPTRIEVYPLRGPLRRECVAVYTERYVPAWGQTVIYPGQRCWWTRG